MGYNIGSCCRKRRFTLEISYLQEESSLSSPRHVSEELSRRTVPSGVIHVSLRKKVLQSSLQLRQHRHSNVAVDQVGLLLRMEITEPRPGKGIRCSGCLKLFAVQLREYHKKSVSISRWPQSSSDPMSCSSRRTFCAKGSYRAMWLLNFCADLSFFEEASFTMLGSVQHVAERCFESFKINRLWGLYGMPRLSLKISKWKYIPRNISQEKLPF